MKNAENKKNKAPLVADLDMYADDFDEKEQAGLSNASTSKVDDQQVADDDPEGKISTLFKFRSQHNH